MADTDAKLNTDREIYREPDQTGNGDAYSDSIHVTEHGSIGINCGGYVIVKPLREWFALAVYEGAETRAPIKRDIIWQRIWGDLRQ